MQQEQRVAVRACECDYSCECDYACSCACRARVHVHVCSVYV